MGMRDFLWANVLVAAGCTGATAPRDAVPDAAPSDGSVAIDAGFAADGPSRTDDSSAGADGSAVTADGSTPTLDGAAFSCDACALGCDETATRCRLPAFSNVSPAFLDGVTSDLAIEHSVELDTDTGSISGIRAAGTGVADGIGFFPGDATTPSVLAVSTLTIARGATLRVRGSRTIAILATGDVVIDGTLDGSAGCLGSGEHCGGPGGGTGGHVEIGSLVPAQGCGAGQSGYAGGRRTDVGFRYYLCGGGAGGANAQPGGDAWLGATGFGRGGSAAACGDGSLVPLRGGSGGGGAQVGGEGGGGGGGIQIASASRVTIGEDGSVLASGAGGAGAAFVNVFHGTRSSYPVGGGGGGGGAGGGILIEAPIVAVERGATIAANGGGGGGSADTGAVEYDGDDGETGTEPASGGDPGSACDGGACGPGGDGGSALALPTAGGSGGGGGGAGVIRIRALPTGFAIEAGATISPLHTTALLGAS